MTLIVPTDDADNVRAVMERHGRAAKPIDNPSIRRVLLAGERQYLTTRGHCDCGTVLVARRDEETLEEKFAKQANRMRRKGWSETKIGRAIGDRHKAEGRPRGDERPDTFELWNTVLRDLGEELRLPYAGLFVGFYSGAVATEAFSATRRQILKNAERQGALSSIEPDEVTIFPLTTRAPARSPS